MSKDRINESDHGSKLKCGIVLMSFSNNDFDLECLLCEKICSIFDDFVNHVKTEHFYSYDADDDFDISSISEIIEEGCKDETFTESGLEKCENLKENIKIHQVEDLYTDDLSKDYGDYKEYGDDYELANDGNNDDLVDDHGETQDIERTSDPLKSPSAKLKYDFEFSTEERILDDMPLESEFQEQSNIKHQQTIELLNKFRQFLGLWHTPTAVNTPDQVKVAAFERLFKTYLSFNPEGCLNDFKNHLNKMIETFYLIYNDTEPRKEPWYYEDLKFLQYANDDNIADEQSYDLSCSYCEDEFVVSESLKELWSHICAHHFEVQKEPQQKRKVEVLEMSENHILQFIDLYRQQKCLWDRSSKSYRNLHLKTIAYKTIINRYNEIEPNVLTDRDIVEDVIKQLIAVFGWPRIAPYKPQQNIPKHLDRLKISKKLYFLRNNVMSQSISVSNVNYTCEFCLSIFFTKTSFFAHKRHCKDHLKTFNDRICPLCHVSFQSFECLENHLKQHIVRSIKKNACDVCAATFQSRNHLILHIRNHKKLKSFFCNICSKGFVEATELREHTLVHTTKTSRPYVCETCGCRYKILKCLESHKRLHLEPSFKCPDCDIKFTTRRKLSDHRRSHAPPEPSECELCDKKVFINKASLERHKRKMHQIKKKINK